MNKYIFLDFDGVFNYIDWWDEDEHYNLVKSLGQLEANYDPKCIKRFKYILSEVPNTKVVLSTSWRLLTSKELAPYGSYPNGIGDSMKKVGLDFDFDAIPNLMPKTRDEEIMKYINNHGCKSFIIIDDENWYSQSPHASILYPRFVHTSYFGKGLDDEAMNKCINLLKYEL